MSNVKSIRKFSNFYVHTAHLEILLKFRSSSDDSVGLGWDLSFWISSKFPGDGSAAGPGIIS